MSESNNSAVLLKSAIQSIEVAQEALKGDMAQLHQAISAVQKRRDGLANSTISFDDYCSLLRESIQRRGEYFARKSVVVENDSRHPDSRKPWHEYASGKPCAFENILNLEPTAGALCFYFPEVIYDRLVTTLRAQYGESWGPGLGVPLDERSSLIQELDSELAGLARQKNELAGRMHEMTKAVTQG